MKTGFLTIEIINWAKHQKRCGDIKNPTWFSLHNEFYSDPKIYALSPEEKYTFIGLLCLTSKHAHKTGKLTISFDQITQHLNLAHEILQSTIEKLKRNQVIKITKVGRRPARGRDTSSTLHNITEQDITKHNITLNPSKKLLFGTQEKTPISEVWNAYKNEYLLKHGVELKWSATFGGLIKNFVKQLGKEDAIGVVKFYIAHKDWFYVKNKHDMKLMVRDAQKLYAEYKSGNVVTSRQAQSQESQNEIADVFKNYLADKGGV